MKPRLNNSIRSVATSCCYDAALVDTGFPSIYCSFKSRMHLWESLKCWHFQYCTNLPGTCSARKVGCHHQLHQYQRSRYSDSIRIHLIHWQTWVFSVCKNFGIQSSEVKWHREFLQHFLLQPNLHNSLGSVWIPNVSHSHHQPFKLVLRIAWTLEVSVTYSIAQLEIAQKYWNALKVS